MPAFRTDIDRKAAMDWVAGHCYAMAAALADRLDARVACLVVDLKRYDEFNPHVVHAWIRTGEGSFDGRGAIDEEAVVADLLDGAGSREIRNDRLVEFDDREAFLAALDRLHGHDDLWASYARDTLPRLIDRAAEFADAHLLEPSAPSPTH